VSPAARLLAASCLTSSVRHRTDVSCPRGRTPPLAAARTTLVQNAPRSPGCAAQGVSTTSEVRVRHNRTLRRRLSFVALWSSSIALAAACGAGARSAADNRAIAIYAAAIRAAADQPIGSPPTTTRSGQIFVVGAHGEIGLSVQAGVADTLESFATIRFVDSRSEAIDTTDPHEAVHGTGMLITLGDIPAGSDNVTIAAQRYERTDRTATLTIELHRTASTWQPVRITNS
jgi:hypothetical protein